MFIKFADETNLRTLRKISLLKKFILLTMLSPLSGISAPRDRAVIDMPDRGDTLPLNTIMDSVYSIIRETDEHIPGSSSEEPLKKKTDAFMRLGKRFYREGLYTNAFNAFTEALRLAEENHIMPLLPDIYSSIGTIYCTWSDYNTGLSYYLKGMELCSPTHDTDTYRSLLINIQGAYINLNDVLNATVFYEKMCAMPAQNETTRYFKEANRGLLLLSEGKQMQAIPFLRHAATLGKELDPSLHASSLDYIGDAYLSSQPDSALLYWEKAVDIQGIPPIMRMGILKKLTDTHKNLHRRDKAIFYGDIYMALYDSIFKISEINRIRDIHLAYENKKKLQQIENLSNEKEQQSIKISRQRWALILVAAVLIIFLAMTAALMRQKRRLHQTYVHLFHSHKETLAAQSVREQRETSLLNEIAELRAELESSRMIDEPTDYAECRINDVNVENEGLTLETTATEPRTQSADRLTEEKRREILKAVENVLRDESLICDPDFSINIMAKTSGINSRYLSQVINDTYGCNFRAKLNECRMIIAQRRILDIKNYGNLTIQAIAESVGYRSQSGFVQLFKKATGFTPSMFQKMAKEDGKSLTDS